MPVKIQLETFSSLKIGFGVVGWQRHYLLMINIGICTVGTGKLYTYFIKLSTYLTVTPIVPSIKLQLLSSSNLSTAAIVWVRKRPTEGNAQKDAKDYIIQVHRCNKSRHVVMSFTNWHSMSYENLHIRYIPVFCLRLAT